MPAERQREFVRLSGAVGAILALPCVAIVQSFTGAYVHRQDVIDEAGLEFAASPTAPPAGAGGPPRPA